VKTIQTLHGLGIWLELVTLLIFGYNDSDAELSKIAELIAGVLKDIP
jgi:pyruvate-formate lyase-activating enzyme